MKIQRGRRPRKWVTARKVRGSDMWRSVMVRVSVGTTATEPSFLTMVTSGFSVFLSGVTLWALVHKRSTKNINILMCTATLLLFTLGTLVSSHSIVTAGFH